MIDNDTGQGSLQYREGLGLRIKRAINATGKTYAEIARAVGRRPQAVYGWIRTGRIGKDTLAALAAATGTSLEWLVSGDDSALQRQAFKVASVPLLRWDQIGTDSKGGEIELVSTSKLIRANSFALVVTGNAMAETFPDGSTILVDPEEEPQDGSFVIASVNGAHVLRQLKKDGSRSVLVAQDKAYPVVPVDENSEIVGVVKMTMRWLV